MGSDNNPARKFHEYSKEAIDLFNKLEYEPNLLFKNMYEDPNIFIPKNEFEISGKDLKIGIRYDKKNTITFKDGEVDITKNNNLSIIPIKDSIDNDNTFYIMNEIDDKIEALITANMNTGFFINTAENTNDDLKIIYNLNQGNDILNKTVIFVTRGSHLKLIKMENGSSDNKSIRYETYNIYVENGASIEIIEMIDYNKNYIISSNFNVFCNGNLNIDSIKSINGFSRYKLNVNLNEDSKSKINIIDINTNKGSSDLYVKVTHKGKNSTSSINVYSITGNGSKQIIKGIARVENNADGSATDLNERVLELGDSNIKMIPAMEIENSNVIASHTDFKKQLDDEKITYLESRGLSKEESKKTLMTAFLPKYEDVKIQEFLDKLIDKSIVY